MMRAPPLRHVFATSVKEAAHLLATDPRAMILAGGTDVVPNLKRRQFAPSMLVSLKRIESLRAIRSLSGGGLSIGAGVSLSDLAVDARFAKAARALRSATAQVATPHIRNVATLGGNLCLDTRCTYYDQNLEWRQAIGYCMKAPKSTGGVALRDKEDCICWVAPQSPKCKAVSSTDSAPALIALGASVVLESKEGERTLPLRELYADDGMAFLTKRGDEILREVVLPADFERWTSTYWKLRRRDSFDFPVLGVGAALKLGSGGTITDARIALGGVLSAPILVPESATLVGKTLTDDVITAFAELAAKHAKPLDNTDLEFPWRKRVTKVFVANALKELRGDDRAAMGRLAERAVVG
ncbi:MAG: FAD binding domain-containing protein [Planctomycetes bacterium]|nr:FAD binding domain-containing protein [Planctomycetota bacterium]